MTTPALASLAIVALVIAALATTAFAASSSQIVDDCIDGSIDGNYSKSELNSAKGEIPDDVAQYTQCLDAISDALSDSKDSKNKVTKLGVYKEKPSTPTKSTLKKLKKATTHGDDAIKIGKSEVIPGSPSLMTGKGLIADLPASVALLVGLIGVLTIATTGLSLYRKREGFKKLGRFFKR